MADINKQLRIPGEIHSSIESVRFLSTRYLSALGRAAVETTFYNSTINQRLHAAQPGDLLLLGDEFTQFDTAERSLKAEITIEKKPVSESILGTTRHESSRGVRFGQLILRNDSLAPAQEYIAIKPTRVERATREAAASRLINANQKSLMGMRTYEPLGFLKQSERNALLLTRYAPNTLSFDAVLWSEEGVPEDKVVDALTKSAISLATLHGGLRVTHGDAQPKNMAWNHTVNAPWGVDFEDARRHTGKSLWDFEDEAEADIATLLLFQPVIRSEDIFEHVANTYSARYYDITEGEQAPVSKDTIMRIRGRHLQPLPRVNR